MRLHGAVETGNWKLFLSLIESGENLCEIDSNGETILHCLARQVVPEKGHGFLSFTKTMTDYFKEISPRTKSFGMTIGDLALIQNADLDTATHIAIASKNWSLAIHLGREVNYIDQKNFRKNRYGLDEYQYARVLYGASGYDEHIKAIFNFWSNQTLVGRSSADFESGFIEIKGIMKSVKFLRSRDKTVFVDSDNKLFCELREEEYPSPFACPSDSQ